MKWRKLHRFLYYSIILWLLIAFGCSTAPALKMPRELPPVVKNYKHVTVYANKPTMVDTGIYLDKGDLFTVFAVGEIDLKWRERPAIRKPGHGSLRLLIGNEYYAPALASASSSRTSTSPSSGEVRLGISDGGHDLNGNALKPDWYRDNAGCFSVDIIVWERDDYVQISDFLEMMKEKDPENKAVSEAFTMANRIKSIKVASEKAKKEIVKTAKEIQALKGESEKGKAFAKAIEEKGSSVDMKLLPGQSITESSVVELEARLAKLNETLAQLQVMKSQLALEREKTSLLTKELEEKEKREKELLTRLEDTSKTPPVIAIASPIEGSKVEVKTITFSGVAEDDQGLQNLEVFINEEPLQKKIGRGIKLPEKRYPKRIDFRERIPLQKGENKIKIRAVDSDGLSAEKMVTVQYVEKRRNVWAVVIGIDHYPDIRQLKYAVNDAEMFYDHLVKYNRIPPENVTLLTDQQATLRKVKSTLGTDLKNKAGKEDMVIIFFAGHGATEKDVMSPDGDGLEKYLLPYDADPKDLYATALPMREISRVFRRVRSERLVFIVDSCYSGASGGRTVGITDIRANLSEAFLDRISSGKGRVILTASGPNEVSAEKDDLKHGVFTYYLVEGLRGRADSDKDGLISLDELYRYVSHKVPEATGQEQHPVKKGTVEGRLILGVIQ